MMHYSDIEIVLQEVPGEISICFTITGCNLRCEGCHSPHTWKEGSGHALLDEIYLKTLKKYKGFASCVLFMGGEWHTAELIKRLKQAKSLGFKTCLYTGLEEVGEGVRKELTWLKTGRWNYKLGGLESKTTNQKFIEIQTNKTLNYLFTKNNNL